MKGWGTKHYSVPVVLCATFFGIMVFAWAVIWYPVTIFKKYDFELSEWCQETTEVNSWTPGWANVNPRAPKGNQKEANWKQREPKDAETQQKRTKNRAKGRPICIQQPIIGKCHEQDAKREALNISCWIEFWGTSPWGLNKTNPVNNYAPQTRICLCQAGTKMDIIIDATSLQNQC